jgi:hypothetical protein
MKKPLFSFPSKVFLNPRQKGKERVSVEDERGLAIDLD